MEKTIKEVLDERQSKINNIVSNNNMTTSAARRLKVIFDYIETGDIYYLKLLGFCK